MEHPAIIELRKLMNDNKVIDNWTKKWLIEVTHSQPVLDKKYITGEYHDVICQHITKESADKLIEKQGVGFDISDHTYTANMLCLKQGKRNF